MHRSHLPILTPCSQRWEAMSGSVTRRHCAACDLDVLGLSAMSADTALDILIAQEGRRCVRYRTDAHGDIQFTPAKRPPPPAAPETEPPNPLPDDLRDPPAPNHPLVDEPELVGELDVSPAQLRQLRRELRRPPAHAS